MYVVNFEMELCKIPVWNWDMYVLDQFFMPFVRSFCVKRS
jgi:hypothetical protein